MGHSDFSGLTAHYEKQLADERQDKAYWKGRCERAEFARQALEHHNAALTGNLTALQQAQHIDTRIVEHLRAGDGTFVLAEHTEDGVTIAFTPTVAVLRDIVLADLRRVESEARVAA